jgi:hypothetical protein
MPLTAGEVGAPEPTPLWFYILKESELAPVSGAYLGPVGGRIVGEVLLGLLELDPRSWFWQDPRWTPTIASRRREQGPADVRPGQVRHRLGMDVSVGTFNLNNLFGRWNVYAERPSRRRPVRRRRPRRARRRY